MSVQQGDHVCFTDPQAPDTTYHPVSHVRGGQAAVFTGKTHQLVPTGELLETAKVGNITYYRWNKRVTPAKKQPAAPVNSSWRCDFRCDGWSRIKVVSAQSAKAARRLAVMQLAREMNRTVPSLNAMIKRPGNSVTIKQGT